MSKALINALTLALLDSDDYHGGMEEAREFAYSFVHENADLLTLAPQATTVAKAAVAPVRPADLREPGQPLAEGEVPRAVVHKVPVVGPDGLTDRQREAVASGVGLCPNCQQPKNRHLPGCARASGYDSKAVTKDPLPPVQ